MHLELPEESRPTKPPPTSSAAYGRASCGAGGGDRARRRHDHGRPKTAGDAGRRREPPATAEPLSAFVRRGKIPFFNTQMGKGAVNAGSKLYIGTAALSERDWVHQAIDQAD